mgnify:CR=1 FL=1
MTERIDVTQLRVVRGVVTADELAAIVVVMNAVLQRNRQRTAASTSEWSAAHRRMRPTLQHGAGAWRRSALPH